MTIGVILLAGGIGTRMKSNIPKQFLKVKNKPVIQYSFDIFMSMKEVTEVVVVCPEEFHHLFKRTADQPILTFAAPGVRRQDSVHNGLKAMSGVYSLACVHDGVRPFITHELVKRVIEAAQQHGAATAGMPVKFTVKECNQERLVTKTPDRAQVWEIQTPQVMKTELLHAGFAFAIEKGLTVTDDVSLIELIGKPVKLVEGCYTNLKLTTPEDISLTEYLLRDR